jgi:hypothetical protein
MYRLFPYAHSVEAALERYRVKQESLKNHATAGVAALRARKASR